MGNRRQIRSKAEWYRVNTLFNTPTAWTLKEFLEVAEPRTIYTTQNRAVIGAPFYKLPGRKMVKLIKQGVLDSNYRVLECIPPKGVTSIVQGEFDGVYGRVTYINEPMRTALLIDQIHITRCELLGHVGMKYYQQLLDISEAFPNHIIEFSIYDTPIGCYNDNMIIWEVRNY